MSFSRYQFRLFELFAVVATLMGSRAAAADVVEVRGETMGTTYSVKWAPDSHDPGEIKELVDTRLRGINRLMSTYDPESELSRFNQSTSTDWHGVSAETALVVEAALSMSRISDGAFDPTVGRLTRMWSFGKDPHLHEIPTQEEIERALVSVGYQHLQVRTSPPALRKRLPELEIDLSAIAKGYAVDAVVELLTEQGINNCMVEIGGEIRVVGSKPNGPWKLGIQRPDAMEGDLKATVELDNQALATSGDYRNYFIHDGIRYSHTIDPRTGSPVTHQLASATIVTDSCMQADAWATTTMVLGTRAGIELADNYGIAAYLIERKGDSFHKFTSQAATGMFADIEPTVSLPSLLLTFLITATVFGIAIAGLAIGVILSNKALKGSCGGANGLKDEQGRSICDLCTTPPEECDRYREKMTEETTASKEHQHSAAQTEST